jgi:crotonobetainyl-CoA:carnitine CoA-transferase CaiB-like acyl-CoA transferase
MKVFRRMDARRGPVHNDRSPRVGGYKIMTTPNEVLRTILSIAGWGDTQAADVMFTGGADPVLQTPFRIGAAAAVTLAAGGLAAAELWRVRTGRCQQVTVDIRQATAALRSGQYLQLAGTDVSSERNGVMGLYPTRDGRWSYLHCNFPNHRAAALGVLGVAEDREAVARAVATWNAADLEEAIIAAKGAGGMARTQPEWAKHPQGVAVAALPLLEIVRIGDSTPERLPAGDRPLSGIRVLDLTRVLAGPTCGRTLAEHGADVLRITGAHLPSLGYQELDTGHGKLAAHLDLRAPGDIDILRGLVRNADVFSQGYRPGTLASRSLSHPAWARLRLTLCFWSHWPLGVTARLRNCGANRQRHGPTSGGVRTWEVAGAAILSDLGDRLLHGLLDGIWCDGGIGTPGSGRRQLAGADFARTSRQVDRRSRRSAGCGAQGYTCRVHRGRVGTLVDSQ